MGGGLEPSCGEQMLSHGGVAALAGGIMGSLGAAWADKPMIPDQTLAHIRFAASNILRSAAVFAAMGAAFAGGKCFAKGLRDKDDALNATVGGVLAGSVVGVASRSHRTAAAAICVMGLVAGAVEYQTINYRDSDNRASEIFRKLQAKSAQSE